MLYSTSKIYFANIKNMSYSKSRIDYINQLTQTVNNGEQKT